jgi:hypothetical protein
VRLAPARGQSLVCVCNFSAVTRNGYRLPLPERGTYRPVLNTDAADYGGSASVPVEAFDAEEQPWHKEPFSALLDLPPLATLWFESPSHEIANGPAPAATGRATRKRSRTPPKKKPSATPTETPAESSSKTAATDSRQAATTAAVKVEQAKATDGEPEQVRTPPKRRTRSRKTE